jgi:hypothetical protein
MADMQWKVILEEGTPASSGQTASTGPQQSSSKAQEDMAAETKKAAPTWASMGRFIGPLVSVAGVLAFVVQMIRRSKVFSTFMDGFLTILSAVVDILFIPLIPLLVPLLKMFAGLIPIAMTASKSITKFLENPWEGLKTIFETLINLPKNIGKFIGNIFTNLGLGGLGDIFSGVGKVLTDAGEKIVPIFNTAVDKIRAVWSDKGLTIWEKILTTAKTVWESIKEAAPIWWEAIKKGWTETISPAIVAEVQRVFGTDAANIISALFNGDFKVAWDLFCTWLGPKIEKIWNDFYSGTLKPVWDKFYNEDLKPKWLEFVNGTLKPYWIAFTTTVGNVWNSLVRDIGKNWSWLMTVIQGYWEWFTKTYLTVLWANLEATVGNFIGTALLSLFATIGTGFINLFAAIWNKIAPGEFFDVKLLDLKEILKGVSGLGNKEETHPLPKPPSLDTLTVDGKLVGEAPGFSEFTRAIKDIPEAWSAATKVISDNKTAISEVTDQISLWEDAVRIGATTQSTASKAIQDYKDIIAEHQNWDDLYTRVGNAATAAFTLSTNLPILNGKVLEAAEIWRDSITKISNYTLPYTKTGNDINNEIIYGSSGGKMASSTSSSTSKSLNINNVFNINSEDSFLARKVSTSLDSEIKSSKLKIF